MRIPPLISFVSFLCNRHPWRRLYIHMWLRMLFEDLKFNSSCECNWFTRAVNTSALFLGDLFRSRFDFLGIHSFVLFVDISSFLRTIWLIPSMFIFCSVFCWVSKMRCYAKTWATKTYLLLICQSIFRKRRSSALCITRSFLDVAKLTVCVSTAQHRAGNYCVE